MESGNNTENDSVRAVVFVRNDRGLLKETLESLKNQDYGNISISIVYGQEHLSDEMVQEVREICPEAEVHSHPNRGFAASVNAALSGSLSSEGDDFFLICTDDVSLDSNAVGLMLRESLRLNMGIAGPKLVQWDNPELILQIGLGMDKTGETIPNTLPGEMDQGQYDLPQNVFALPGACFLVRRDIFQLLGGFDEGLKDLGFFDSGQDLDFCWRARVAGASVFAVPDAAVRWHRGYSRHRGKRALRKTSAFEKQKNKNRIRSLVSCYGFWHSVRILPQAFCISLMDFLGSILSGRLSSSRGSVSAWFLNFFRLPSILKKRSVVHRSRALGDREIRTLQEKGFAYFTLFFRGHDTKNPVHRLGTSLRGLNPWTIPGWTIFVLVILFGARHLITRFIPVVGDFLLFDDDMFDGWLSTWRSNGLGTEGAAPTSYFWTALVQTVFFGMDGLARTVFLIAPLFLGPWGAWHFAGKYDKSGLRIVIPFVYLSIPLVYISLGGGSLHGLVLYGAGPWILSVLTGYASVFKRGGFLVSSALKMGLLCGLVISFVPQLIIWLGLLALAFMFADLLAGSFLGALEFFVKAVAGLAVAFILNFPWIFEFEFSRLAESEAENIFNLKDLLIFDTGSIGGISLIWALVAASGVSLFFASGQRLTWILRGWILFLGGVGLAWAYDRRLVEFGGVELFLSAAGLGLTLAVYFGVLAVRDDLSGSKTRRLLSVFMTVAILVGIIPALGIATGGRLNMPRGDFQSVFDSLDADNHRVLWIGHPSVLTGSSSNLTGDMNFSVTEGAKPDLHVNNSDRVSHRLLNSADRLGGELAFFSIKYVIVQERAAPKAFGTRQVGADPRLLEILDSQLDLRRISAGSGVFIYENIEALPIKAELETDVLQQAFLDPQFVTSVFTNSSRTILSSDRDFYLGTSSPRWRLTVGGEEAERREVLGWSGIYGHTGGEAELRYETSSLYHGALLGQILLWVFVVMSVFWINTTRTKRQTLSSARGEES